MGPLRRFSNALNRVLLWGASLVMVAAMLMAVANMAGRPLKMPVEGSFELMGFASAVIAAFALGFAQQRHGHIAVDILFQRFPRRVRRLLAALGNLACAAFFAVTGWWVGRFAVRLWETGEVSETLGISTYPFAACVAVGVGALSLALLVDVFEELAGRGEVD